MSKKRIISILSMVMAIAMLLSACGGGQTGQRDNTEITTGGGDVTEGTDSGKTNLRFAIVSEPASLNPGEFGDQYSKLAILQIYETLVREAIGERTKLEPLIAESWKFNDDGTELTFTIKKGIKFHNGDTLTSEDVAFSLNKAMKEPTNLDLGSMMEKAEVVDENNVVLKLKYAYNPVLNILAIPTFSIINKAYYEKCQEEGLNFGREPIGTGPYVFEQWDAGSKMLLSANESWHGGEAKIPDLEFLFMTDATTAAIALESDDVDVLFGVDSADLPRLRENEQVNVLSVQSSGFYFIMMNQAREPFDDIRVRQAISYCVDRRDIIDGGQDGVGWVTQMMITPGVFGHDENFEAFEQDFDKAKTLLAEAGYENGLNISMICPEASYYARPAQVIQEQLRQGGITVDLQIMERGAFGEQYAARDFETAYYWVGATYPDADSIVYKLYHKDLANIAGETNMSNVVNDDATRLVEAARVSIDNDERFALYGELMELNRDNAWYVPILTSTNSVCARVEVGGAYGHSAALYHVSDWWF